MLQQSRSQWRKKLRRRRRDEGECEGPGEPRVAMVKDIQSFLLRSHRNTGRVRRIGVRRGAQDGSMTAYGREMRWQLGYLDMLGGWE